MVDPRDFVVDLKRVDEHDGTVLGEKVGQFGKLHEHRIPLKKGFVITPQAFFLFLKANRLDYKINHLLGAANFEDPHSVFQTAVYVRRLINNGEIPQEIAHDIFVEYKKMGGVFRSGFVNLSYSPLARFKKYTKTLPHADAVHITGETALLATVRRSWALFFSAHVLYDFGDEVLKHFKNMFSLIVLESTSPQLSGVIYTKSQRFHKNTMSIQAQYGISKNEKNDCDEVIVNKVNGEVVEKSVRNQEIQVVLKKGLVVKAPVPKSLQREPKLTTSTIAALTQIAKDIEHLYFFPQKIVWEYIDGTAYVTDVQSFHEVYIPPQIKKEEPVFELPRFTPKLLSGTSLSRSIGIGHVCVISHPSDFAKIKTGSVVIASEIPKSHFPQLKKAGGIVIENSKVTEDLKYFAKVTQIPAIYNVKDARKHFKNGNMITVHAKNGTVVRGSMMLHAIY